jgi:hypothetical protein
MGIKDWFLKKAKTAVDQDGNGEVNVDDAGAAATKALEAARASAIKSSRNFALILGGAVMGGLTLAVLVAKCSA